MFEDIEANTTTSRMSTTATYWCVGTDTRTVVTCGADGLWDPAPFTCAGMSNRISIFNWLNNYFKDFPGRPEMYMVGWLLGFNAVSTAMVISRREQGW